MLMMNSTSQRTGDEEDQHCLHNTWVVVVVFVVVDHRV